MTDSTKPSLAIDHARIDAMSEPELAAVIGGVRPDDGGCIPMPFPDPWPFPDLSTY